MRKFTRLLTRHFATIRRDCSGSIVMEFALLAPAFLLLVFGVLQVGIGLQKYNAMRNLSADVARYTMVQKQSGNSLNNSQIRTYAITRAQGAPYLLSSSRVNAVVTTPLVQRVAGAQELQVTVTYQMESLLEFAGIEMPFVTYTRPIFLIEG